MTMRRVSALSSRGRRRETWARAAPFSSQCRSVRDQLLAGIDRPRLSASHFPSYRCPVSREISQVISTKLACCISPSLVFRKRIVQETKVVVRLITTSPLKSAGRRPYRPRSLQHATGPEGADQLSTDDSAGADQPIAIKHTSELPCRATRPS